MDQKGSPASWKEGKKKKIQTKHSTQKRKERGEKKALPKKKYCKWRKPNGEWGIKFSPLVWKQTDWGTTSG